jgi:hypothetical protein
VTDIVVNLKNYLSYFYFDLKHFSYKMLFGKKPKLKDLVPSRIKSYLYILDEKCLRLLKLSSRKSKYYIVSNTKSSKDFHL